MRVFREKRFDRWQVQRLKHVLNKGRVNLFIYHVETDRFTILGNNGEPINSYDSEEMASQFSDGQFDILAAVIRMIVTKKKKTIKTSLITNNNSKAADSGKTEIVLSVLHWKNGKPTEIMGASIDATADFHRQQQSKENLLRYKSIFNTMMLDVVAFDADGLVTDMNERAMKTFNTNMEKARQDKLSYSQAIDPKDLEDLGQDTFHATLLLDPLTGQRALRPIKPSEAICYEMKLEPVFGPDQQFLGYYGSGLDVTERAQAYREIQKSSRQLEETAKLISNYVSDIDYVMASGGAFIISYSPTSHTLTVFKGANRVFREFSQSFCFSMLSSESRQSAIKIFTDMDNLEDKTIECVVQTDSLRKGLPVHYQIELIPNRDNKNRVNGYIGICLDISDLENARHMLEKETAYAQEVESQKNTFLHDMSFEIRTPLNSVVGFAELLKQGGNKKDEDIFISQIKENSSFLLHLINSILFISRLDAHMVEIEKKPTDFVSSFAYHCQSGWEEYRQEGVDCEVEIPYEELVIEIDDINVGHIIRNLTANAAQNTKQGAITAICDYKDEKLIISVSDTGRGMSENTLAHAFERFATDDHMNVGLGLPICKELASQMGGTIEIHSHLRHGTTVKVCLPCKATSIKRKEEKSC
jgi:signal transduction histidine kinase